MNEILTVQEIYEHLDQYVVGQEDAKKLIAYSGYMHQLRFYKSKKNLTIDSDIKDAKRNIREAQSHVQKLEGYKGELIDAIETLESGGLEVELDAVLLDYIESLDTEIELEERCKSVLTQCKEELEDFRDNLEEMQYGLEKLEDTKDFKYTTKKSNALIIGPSGCGKTYLIQKLGELLEFPVVIINATQITASGWSGHDLDMYINQIATSKDPNKDATIIFIDEFDKICVPAIGSGGSDHNKNTQNSFLTLLESDKYTIEETGPRRNPTEVDISNVLFLFGGNFEYIRKAEAAASKKQEIGFVTENSEKKRNKSISALLQEHNVAREIAGRISLMAAVKDLTREQLHSVLFEAKDNIYDEYQQLTNLELTPEDVEEILDICIDAKTGARGLRAAIDKIVMDKLFSGELSDD